MKSTDKLEDLRIRERDEEIQQSVHKEILEDALMNGCRAERCSVDQNGTPISWEQVSEINTNFHPCRYRIRNSEQLQQRVPDGWMLFPKEAWDFLRGVGQLNGLSYGEQMPDAPDRPFWWRSEIGVMLKAAPQPPEPVQQQLDPDVDLEYIADVLGDYCDMQVSGQVPSANRYPVADVMVQIEALTLPPAPQEQREGD